MTIALDAISRETTLRTFVGDSPSDVASLNVDRQVEHQILRRAERCSNKGCDP